jgi:hypothetical protein
VITENYMKKLLFTTALVLSYLSSFGCDLCGCYLGVLPKYDQNFIGARMRYRTFSGNVPHVHDHSGGQHDPQAITDTHFHAHDYFTTYDLMGRYFLNSRLSLTGYVPYSINVSEEGENHSSISGFGDPSLLVQYRLFTRESQSDTTWQYNFTVGAGGKLPLGKYNEAYASGEYDPHAQAGTGSVDFLFLANYMTRYNKFGLNTDIVYRLNTKNPLGYKYGNRLNGTLHFIYWKEIDNLKILPQLGIYVESAPADKLNNWAISNTGGFSLFASGGVDVFYKNLSINCIFQAPVIEKLDGNQLKNNYRVITGLSYYL